MSSKSINMRVVFNFFLQLFIIIAVIIINFFYPDVLQWTEKNLIIKAIFNFTIFTLFVNLISRLVKYYYSKKFKLPKGVKDNVHYGISNITTVVLGLAFTFSVFGAFGIELKEIITSLSIVAAALAIILKDFINDFLVGLYFSFSEDFDMGDQVKIGEIKGKIVEIGIQRIRFQNEDDDIVVIPNSKIYQTEIINYTKKDIRLTNIDFQLSIDLIGNIENLEKELIKTLQSFDEYIEPQSYNLKVISIKKDYIDFKFLYKIKKLDTDLQRTIRKKTIKEVFNYISKRNNQLQKEKG